MYPQKFPWLYILKANFIYLNFKVSVYNFAFVKVVVEQHLRNENKGLFLGFIRTILV